MAGVCREAWCKARTGQSADSSGDWSAEMEERLRQFLASRGEIAAGDRMVLRALRARARERQRFWLGVPLVVAGAAGGLAAGRAAMSSWKQPTRDKEDRS
jgi:hypothetical protein